MKYADFINENLLNNFIDRRQMVQIMLQDLILEERNLIIQKLKLTNFGNTLLENTLSERDHFSVVSYYYLAKETDKCFEENFILYANDYLMKYKDFSDVLSHLKLKEN